MLAWVWRGVLAFDRIGQRIPQLVQMMVEHDVKRLSGQGASAK